MIGATWGKFEISCLSFDSNLCLVNCFITEFVCDPNVIVVLLAEAVPKKILDMMNVENITRENVASHLQAFF
jgi:hypothetical protein